MGEGNYAVQWSALDRGSRSILPIGKNFSALKCKLVQSEVVSFFAPHIPSYLIIGLFFNFLGTGNFG